MTQWLIVTDGEGESKESMLSALDDDDDDDEFFTMNVA